ncbi:MAG: aldose 1-epimerase family protein [Planctomycetota bacterium]
MPTQSITLRNSDDRNQRIQWNENSPLHLSIETRAGVASVRHGVFRGGVSEGVEIVRLSTDRMHVDVLPTRGMSIWRITRGDVRFGWQSPVVGPVHPMHVPLTEPSGLGWLSGFDELLVRCGLHSNGAPVHDDNGRLIYPLHGHIANTPADALGIEFDEASGRIELFGEMIESRLFFKRLRLRTRLRLHVDRDEIEILDDVTNELDVEATMQLLYHINVGVPVLGPDARLVAPLDEIAPKDGHSAKDIESYEQYGAPEPGALEQVYLARPSSDASGYGQAMLVSADQTSAFLVSMKTSTLPFLTLWKNTAGLADGYVTGIEPGTNFPNGRDVEASANRVVTLDPGQTKSFRIKLHPMVKRKIITQSIAELETIIRENQPAVIHSSPHLQWTADDQNRSDSKSGVISTDETEAGLMMEGPDG